MYLVDKLPTVIGQARHSLSGGLNFIPLSTTGGASVDMSSFRAGVFGMGSSTAGGGGGTSGPGGAATSSSSPRNNDVLSLSNTSNGAHGHDSTKSTSVGLIIHALADGIALGASVATHNSALETIVFLAIMVHKAPAAFGLSAVLLQAGGVARAKRTLAVFAASAPVGAGLTFAIISVLGSSDLELIEWWTGVLLLFSGGTFLFVAVHVMQEVNEGHSSSSSGGSGSGEQESSIGELGISVIGMMIPMLTMLIPED